MDEVGKVSSLENCHVQLNWHRGIDTLLLRQKEKMKLTLKEKFSIIFILLGISVFFVGLIIVNIGLIIAADILLLAGPLLQFFERKNIK